MPRLAPGVLLRLAAALLFAALAALLLAGCSGSDEKSGSQVDESSFAAGPTVELSKDFKPIGEYADVASAAAEASRLAGFHVRTLDHLPPGFEVRGMAVDPRNPGGEASQRADGRP
ncbi:MAG: hypothetical protein ACM3S1_00860 [Hyphomicrobiales bacterium]